jgi:hypothetical protein
MPQKKYAEIGWIAQDIIDNAKENGIRITKRKAKLFLEQYEMKIIDAMVNGGWAYMEIELPDFLETLEEVQQPAKG